MKVVTLSRNATNVKLLIESILKNEPGFDLADFIVVADGPVEQWEQLSPRPTILQGEQPFVFARNANIGIRHANSDVILMNDDTELVTFRGFTNLSQAERRGITSAKIDGYGAVYVDHFCAFVCVFIPKLTQERVGLLDERFVLYGYEDDDYCRRVRQQSLPINLCGECVVKHYHPDRSTFHGEGGLYAGDNMVAFDKKWGIKREYIWPEHLEQIKE